MKRSFATLMILTLLLAACAPVATVVAPTAVAPTSAPAQAAEPTAILPTDRAPTDSGSAHRCARANRGSADRDIRADGHQDDANGRSANRDERAGRNRSSADGDDCAEIGAGDRRPRAGEDNLGDASVYRLSRPQRRGWDRTQTRRNRFEL